MLREEHGVNEAEAHTDSGPCGETPGKSSPSAAPPGALLLRPEELRAIDAELAARGLDGTPTYAAWRRAAIARAALRALAVRTAASAVGLTHA